MDMELILASAWIFSLKNLEPLAPAYPLSMESFLAVMLLVMLHEVIHQLELFAFHVVKAMLRL